jgi:type III pantothenate kinase
MNMENTEYYVVDAGNSRTKIARYYNDELRGVQIFADSDEDTLQQELERIQSNPSILSSVVSEEKKKRLIEILQPTVVLTDKTNLPISLEKYKTPETLGADRIANAVAGYSLAKQQNTLIVDIGTCVKFDFVDDKGNYQGGSISPGMLMRFKAMHDYTGQLPLIDSPEDTDLIGQSTFESMNTGVMVGMNAEIDGMIGLYSQKFTPLTIFLTGGDHKRFDKGLKNSIFAENNLTLHGLYLILKHNV